tara:strand:- start:299 stop:604 length:306 start_codon:yes stop_codon:yes gene_type:complete
MGVYAAKIFCNHWIDHKGKWCSPSTALTTGYLLRMTTSYEETVKSNKRFCQIVFHKIKPYLDLYNYYSSKNSLSLKLPYSNPFLKRALEMQVNDALAHFSG